MFLRAFDGQLPECVQVFILVGSGHLKPGPVCAGSFYGLLHPFQVGLDDEIACIISVSIHLVQSVKNLLSRVCLHALFYCCRGGMDLQEETKKKHFVLCFRGILGGKANGGLESGIYLRRIADISGANTHFLPNLFVLLQPEQLCLAVGELLAALLLLPQFSYFVKYWVSIPELLAEQRQHRGSWLAGFRGRLPHWLDLGLLGLPLVERRDQPLVLLELLLDPLHVLHYVALLLLSLVHSVRCLDRLLELLLQFCLDPRVLCLLDSLLQGDILAHLLHPVALICLCILFINSWLSFLRNNHLLHLSQLTLRILHHLVKLLLLFHQILHDLLEMLHPTHLRLL